MKNHFANLALSLMATLSLASCRESSKLPEPKYENVPIVIPEINPEKSFFDWNIARLSVNNAVGMTRPVFEFTVNPSQGYSELQTVEVYKSFRRGSTYGPRVKVTDVTTFPTTITLDSQQALDGLFPSSQVYTTVNGVPTTTPVLPRVLPVKGVDDASINRIDNPSVNKNAVIFTFEYIMKDGRRIIMTPLNTSVNTSATGSILPNAFNNRPLAAVAEFRLP
jgi:hypothetical protein